MPDDGEWDPRKAAANLKNHGVDFAEAVAVLPMSRPSPFETMKGKGTRNVS